MEFYIIKNGKWNSTSFNNIFCEMTIKKVIPCYKNINIEEMIFNVF